MPEAQENRALAELDAQNRRLLTLLLGILAALIVLTAVSVILLN